MANNNNEACSNTNVSADTESSKPTSKKSVKSAEGLSTESKASGRKLIEKSLLEIKRLRKQVAGLQQISNGAIAIVGVGCRLPGQVNNLNDLWRVLVEGQDCISYDGKDRWPWQEVFDENQDAPGKLYTKAMGLIEEPIAFDAEFFGISPREASEIDPQQRLLLEVSYQAMENAGYSLQSLKGSKTGVFMGISSQDYSQLGSRFGEPEDITPWQGTGVSPSAAAGRLSYLYDFNGPSLAVDTACSSSLVALHYACQSLRHQECDAALVGGVNMILNPGTSILFAKAKMLSVDGSCKAFDQDANGYVRAEGCSVVMVKRLRDAIADGDHIQGVIRGSAVNQDGRSQGLTAPNEISQQKVINAALQQARCRPEDITYVEAHGTGTPLGDPIELNALQEVYGKHKNADQPLNVGSCKTNFGHAEAAAGMFGLLKLVVSLQRKKIPASLHFSTPNPYVDWANMNVRVSDTLQDWPQGELRAGLSGFGFTGTNAHVIVEAYTSSDALVKSPRHWQPQIFPLSAKNAEALTEAENALANYFIKNGREVDTDTDISSGGDNLSEVAYTLAVGRDHYHHRSAFTASNPVMFSGKKNKPNSLSLFQFSSDTGIERSQLEFLRQQLPVFDRYYQSIQSQLEVGDTDTISKPFSLALDRFCYLYGIAQTLMSWGIKPKILLSREIQEFSALEQQYSAAKLSVANFSIDRTVQIIASELAAASIAGLVLLEDAITALVNLVELCVDNTKEVKTIQYRKPRLAFVSQLMIRNGMPVQFSGDTAITENWYKELVTLAKTNCVEDSVEDSVVVEWGTIDLGARDLTITLGNDLEVQNHNVMHEPMDESKDNNFGLYARRVQGRTNYLASVSEKKQRVYLEKLESLLVQAYVIGVDIDWSSVFVNAKQAKIQLPGYPFQRKDHWNNAIPLDLLNISSVKKAPELVRWGYQYSLESVDFLSNEMSLPQPWVVISDTEQKSNALYSQLISRGHQASAFVLQSQGEGVELRDVWNEENTEVIDGPETFQTWLERRASNTASNVLLCVGNEIDDGDRAGFTSQYSSVTKLTLWLAQTLAKVPNIALWTITANGLVDGQVVDDQVVDEQVEGEEGMSTTPPYQRTRLSCSSVLLTGFSKVLALELSDVMQGHLDYQTSSSELDKTTASVLVDALMSELPAANLHFNGVEWLRPVLKKLPTGSNIGQSSRSNKVKFQFQSDAFYLIAGGTGSIGLSLAQRLIDRGAKRIVLLSRSGVDKNSSVYSIIEKMRDSAEIHTPAIDITDRELLSDLLAQLRCQYPIAGVIHAAGVFDVSPLSSLTADACYELMDNKVLGLRWLDELTFEDKLDLFVGFSSIASVWGSAGNFHYSAANYFVDALIHRRRRHGLPGMVINWGPWAESNMVTNDSELQANKRGLFVMDKAQALDWFEQLLSYNTSPQTIVAKVQWQRLKPLLELTKMGSLLRHLSDFEDSRSEFPAGENAVSVTKDVSLNAEDIVFKQQLEKLSHDDAQVAMLQYITQQLANALESEVEDIDVFQPLLNLGIDSLMAVEFKNRVTKVTGVEIPLVRLLEGSHLCDLSEMLCEEYFVLQADSQDASPQLPENTDIDTASGDDEELFLEGAL